MYSSTLIALITLLFAYEAVAPVLTIFIVSYKGPGVSCVIKTSGL